MKVIMIGTPICAQCKAMAPVVEELCEEHGIEFTYMNLGDAPKHVLNLLQNHGIKQAPAYILTGDEDDIVEYVGNDIVKELESF